MYRGTYADVLADDQMEARSREAAALDIVIERLTSARNAPEDEARRNEALDAMEALWSIFLSDVASPENALSHDIRRSVVTIGRALFARSAVIRDGGEASLDFLIDVNVAIRNGLTARA